METTTNDTTVHARSTTKTTEDDEHRHYGQPILGLDRRTPRMRVDLTINIPTMIMIATLIITTSATGVGLYYSLDKRQMTTDFTVATLSQRLEKAEAAVSVMKADQVRENATLRGEMKSDITEIKDLLNRLIFSPQSQQPASQQQRQQLREWSK